MPAIQINDVELHYQVQGSGPPLVLVHGSWDSHAVWQDLAPRLADRFRVITYDRRGHSRSERPAGPRTRCQDEDDLAGLIAALAGEAAYVVGNSFGGLVSLGLAARRPELVRALAVHEPPGVSVVDGGELERLAAEAVALLPAILVELEGGAVESATRRFIDDVAVGPGTWESMPYEERTALIANAPAFVAEQSDTGALSVDVEAVCGCGTPLLLTTGDGSPRWLQLLVGRLDEVLPHAETATIRGAGHVPHETHPAEYAETLDAFLRRPAGIAA